MSMVETTMDETWSSWESLLGLGRLKMNFGDVLTNKGNIKGQCSIYNVLSIKDIILDKK